MTKKCNVQCNYLEYNTLLIKLAHFNKKVQTVIVPPIFVMEKLT